MVTPIPSLLPKPPKGEPAPPPKLLTMLPAIAPIPPGMREKSNKFALVLFKFPVTEICWLLLNLFKFKEVKYLFSVPAPAVTFPKYPLFLSFFNCMFKVFVGSPSFTPVNADWSP